MVRLTSSGYGSYRVEQSVYGLLRTRDMVMARYKEFSIPVQWMLDSGIIGKVCPCPSFSFVFFSEEARIRLTFRDQLIRDEPASVDLLQA